MNAMVNIIQNCLAERLSQVRQCRRQGLLENACIGDAEIFEGYLMLSLGFQAAFLTNEEFNWLSDSLFGPFFFELQARGESNLRDWPQFVEHSDESEALISRFQVFQRGIEVAMRGEHIGPELVYIPDGEVLAKYVDKCLLMYCSIVQDIGFGQYYRVLTMAPDDEWREMMANPPNYSDVLAAFDDPSDSASSLFYGFLRLIGYLTQLEEVAVTAASDAEINKRSATYFRERLRDIFNWRVMMPSYKTSHRVDAVRDKLVRVVSKDDLGRQTEKVLNSAIENAFGMWYVSA